MKERTAKKGLTILGVVTMAIVLITAVSMSISNGSEGFFGNVISAVTRPARVLMSSIADNLERVYSYMYEYDRLVEEKEELEETTRVLHTITVKIGKGAEVKKVKVTKEPLRYLKIK